MSYSLDCFSYQRESAILVACVVMAVALRVILHFLIHVPA